MGKIMEHPERNERGGLPHLDLTFSHESVCALAILLGDLYFVVTLFVAQYPQGLGAFQFYLKLLRSRNRRKVTMNKQVQACGRQHYRLKGSMNHGSRTNGALVGPEGPVLETFHLVLGSSGAFPAGITSITLFLHLDTSGSQILSNLIHTWHTSISKSGPHSTNIRISGCLLNVKNADIL
jgi:hypothetical protein